MIVKGLFELVLNLLEILFGWVEFPSVNAMIRSVGYNLINIIENGMAFIWLIVPRGLIVKMLAIILVCENFDKLYSVTMWILKKIPFLGLK